MKTLMNLILCSALLMIASCGKDNKSGNSNSQNAPTSGNLNYGTSREKLNAWYTSSQEGSFPGIGQAKEIRKTYTYAEDNGCDSKAISIFGLNLGDINYCFNINSPTEEVKDERILSVTPSAVKSQNPKLAAAFAGTGMTLVQVTEDQSMYGRVFYLEYQKPNGHRVDYVIDTGIHSSFNPVGVRDSESRTVEQVTSIKTWY